jgi:hypothetical protein
MTAAWIIAGTALGAASFWLRGSARFEEWTGRGKTTGDAAWAVVMAGLCVAAGLSWPWGGALALALFAGGRLPWWGSLDFGTVSGTYARDFALHSLRGLLWTLAAGVVLWFAGGSPWAIAAGLSGLLAGPCWALGYLINPPPLDGTEPRHPNATEIGEIAFGAVTGAALLAAVTL